VSEAEKPNLSSEATTASVKREQGVKHAGAAGPVQPRRRRRSHVGFIHFAQGEPMIWVTGGALALCLSMILGMLVYVLIMGSATFWPLPIAQIETRTGQTYLGEVTRTQTFVPGPHVYEGMMDEAIESIRLSLEETEGEATRRLYRTGNYDLTGTRFHWVPDFMVVEETYPQWALMFERLEWGVFYGFPKSFAIDGEIVADTPEEVWRSFQQYHPEIRHRWRERRELEVRTIGRVNRTQEEARLAYIGAQHRHAAGRISDEQLQQARETYREIQTQAESEHAEITAQINELNQANARYVMLVDTVDGREFSMPLAEVVRAHPANQLNLGQKLSVYISRWREFLLDDPREANTEGGVYPAIVGTVVMTLVMTIFVVPFGVLAALYLREYAKSGPLVSAIRIAINNLAGVPSIVFGVFGLGFFCYIMGGYIDEWFFSERLPSPTFRKGGVLWASATLALLTLPVVIVATEEALAAVSSSMREGSYACGASKWQTIKRIVLPRAMPGIMTGMILAMARGAGEVAPLMLVGAVMLAPDLPMDVYDWSGQLGPVPTGPVHLDRSFMHLGFHIYDVGFQSSDSEAARPMVFTTTMLLIAIVVVLNLTAMWLRTRLRRRFAGSQF